MCNGFFVFPGAGLVAGREVSEVFLFASLHAGLHLSSEKQKLSPL